MGKPTIHKDAWPEAAAFVAQTLGIDNKPNREAQRDYVCIKNITVRSFKVEDDK